MAGEGVEEDIENWDWVGLEIREAEISKLHGNQIYKDQNCMWERVNLEYPKSRENNVNFLTAEMESQQ